MSRKNSKCLAEFFLLPCESLLQPQIIQVSHRVDPEVLGGDIYYPGIAQGEERSRCSLPLRPEDGKARTAVWCRRPIWVEGVDKVDWTTSGIEDVYFARE